MARRCAFSIVLVCLLAACGRAPERTPAPLTDDWGRAVALAAPPRRIVSLSPAATELVFALGLGDRLVGRTTWCDWPAAAKQVPDMGNGLGPNVEVVAGQRPDLVLLYPSEANRAAAAQLAGLGIAVAALRQDAIADWRHMARWVARAAGVPERADSLLADFDRRLAAARVTIADADRPTVFIAVGANPPLAIGAGSFLSELVSLAGGRNIFDDLPGPSGPVSLEAVVTRDPDWVVVPGPDSAAASLGGRAGWRAIRAVRTGRVMGVDGSRFDRPSPRLPEAVAAVAFRLRAASSSSGR